MIIPQTISLVITTFNRPQLLQRAIDSIYNYNFDEIVVINDGSSIENTILIEAILKQYPKIIYYTHKINKGLGEARNSGVNLSNSEWILYLDDDDYFIKNPIDDLKKFIQSNPEADIIHFKIRNQQTNKDIVDWGHEKFTLEELISSNRLAGCSMLKKSVWQILNGYKTMPYEDWEFWIRAKKVNFNFCFYPDVFYFREHHIDGLEDTAGKLITDEQWKNLYIDYLLPSKVFNTEICIGITTFLRDSSLFRLIASLLKYMPEFKLYIVDQGLKNPKKEKLYSYLTEMGHIIKYVPYDSGISLSRKILKDICQEPYLVYMEDDFVATEKTNLYKLKEILEENEDLGVVGGNLQGYATTGAYSFFFDYADSKICYFPLDYLVGKNLNQWETTSKNTKFIKADIVSDFTMWKKEVPNIFDENVKVIEHSHVYLLIKYKTHYKVAFCPESEIKHLHSGESEEYNQFRKRKTDLDYLKKYWKINEFYQFNKDNLIKLETAIPKIQNVNIVPIILPPKKEINNNIETTKPTIAEIVKPIKEEVIINPVKNYSPEEILSILNNNKINYIIIKDTCLNLICQKEISFLHLCVPNNEELGKINQLFPDNNFNIEISYIKETKIHNYKNIQFKVPFPVIKYLEKTFNKSWQELQNGI